MELNLTVFFDFVYNGTIEAYTGLGAGSFIKLSFLTVLTPRFGLDTWTLSGTDETVLARVYRVWLRASLNLSTAFIIIFYYF